MTWRIVPTGGGCTALEHEKLHFSVWITDFDGSSAADESSEEVNVCFFLNHEKSELFSIPQLKALSSEETPGFSIGDELYWSYRINLLEIVWDEKSPLDKIKAIVKDIPNDTFISKVVLAENNPDQKEMRQ